MEKKTKIINGKEYTYVSLSAMAAMEPSVQKLNECRKILLSANIFVLNLNQQFVWKNAFVFISEGEEVLLR